MADNLSNHMLYVKAPGSGAWVGNSLRTWGLLDARVNMQEGGDDSMVLTIAEGDWNTSGITPLSRLELFAPNGRRVFCGVAEEPEEAYQGGKMRWVWKVSGPLYWLEKLPYTQALKYFEDPTIESSAEAETESSVVILNRVPNGGSRVTLRQQIAEVFSQARDKGAPVACVEAEIPEDEIAEQRERVAMLKDVLRALARSYPGLSLSWDYDTAIVGSDVTLRVREYHTAALGATSGTMKQGAATVTLRTVAAGDVEGSDPFSLQPLYRLLVRKLRVQFVWKNVIESGGRKLVRRGVVEQTSTFENGAFGEYLLTIPLRGATLSDGEVTSEPEPVPAGNLASRLHKTFARLWHGAEWTWWKETPMWDMDIGRMCRLTGVGRVVEVVSIGVSHDVASGRTTVSAGPPTRLTVLTLPIMERGRWTSPEWGRDPEDQDQLPFDPDTIVTTPYRMPLDVVDAGTALQVVPGKICNLDITTVGGTADWTFERSAGKIYLKATVTISSRVVTVRELHKAASIPAPSHDSDSVTGYLELATVTGSGAGLTVTQAYNGSRWVSLNFTTVSCGGGDLVLEREMVWS